MHVELEVIQSTFIFWPIMQKLQSWNAPYRGSSVMKKLRKKYVCIFNILEQLLRLLGNWKVGNWSALHPTTIRQLVIEKKSNFKTKYFFFSLFATNTNTTKQIGCCSKKLWSFLILIDSRVNSASLIKKHRYLLIENIFICQISQSFWSRLFRNLYLLHCSTHKVTSYE